jgi:hypothetical protein
MMFGFEPKEEKDGQKSPFGDGPTEFIRIILRDNVLAEFFGELKRMLDFRKIGLTAIQFAELSEEERDILHDAFYTFITDPSIQEIMEKCQQPPQRKKRVPLRPLPPQVSTESPT